MLWPSSALVKTCSRIFTTKLLTPRGRSKKAVESSRSSALTAKPFTSRPPCWPSSCHGSNRDSFRSCCYSYTHSFSLKVERRIRLKATGHNVHIHPFTTAQSVPTPKDLLGAWPESSLVVPDMPKRSLEELLARLFNLAVAPTSKKSISEIKEAVGCLHIPLDVDSLGPNSIARVRAWLNRYRKRSYLFH